MKNTNRKVDEQAREEISNILLFEIGDPRLEFVTITSCHVSYDRSVADIYFTTNHNNYENAKCAFEKAKGRIRSLMSQRLSWRKTPELRFHLDDVIDSSERIEDVIEAEKQRYSR